jgi:TonB family protein
MTLAAVVVALLCAQPDGGVSHVSSLLGPVASADGGSVSVASIFGPGELPFDGVDLRTAAKLSKEEIREAIRKRTPAVRRCYEQALQRDRPDASGSLTVSFTIGPAGTVTHAEVREASLTFSPTFTRCVVDAIKPLTTGPPRGGGEVKVNFPFTFTPG